MNVVFEDVSFVYPGGVEALRHVNLTIAPGELVAILGENGAGKTTLVKHLNGLLKPTTGRVLVDGWDTREHSTAQLARRVGYVFQNPDDQLFEQSVRAEVVFGPRNLGFGPGETASLADEALLQAGLDEVADSHPYDLSVSQRKLLALASVLAMRTPVVILDEPTTGQDARGMARIEQIIQSLKAQGRTLIVISHDADFCAEQLERVILMSGGELLADGPLASVFAQGELLARANVEAPQLARLGKALGLQSVPRTANEFVEMLAHSRGSGATIGST